MCPIGLPFKIGVRGVVSAMPLTHDVLKWHKNIVKYLLRILIKPSGKKRTENHLEKVSVVKIECHKGIDEVSGQKKKQQ